MNYFVSVFDLKLKKGYYVERLFGNVFLCKKSRKGDYIVHIAPTESLMFSYIWNNELLCSQGKKQVLNG